MVKHYKIYKIEDMFNMTAPYAVFMKCNGFWQQISPWYFRRGNAERYLWKITKEFTNGKWNYTQINGRDRLTSVEIEIENPCF